MQPAEKAAVSAAATTVGEYHESDDAPDIESLTLRFSPGSLPIKQRWRNNGLSADFLADYVSTFFPRIEEDQASEARRREIAGAVKYIANELLENAMKYSLDPTPQPISIQLQLDHERIAFWASNAADAVQADRLRAFVARLMSGDPDELYLEQIQSGAETGSEGSGLGFLTMINDYGARLAWRFVPLGAATGITTHVHLAI